MREMSTLCSAAILRTSGVDFVRSRSSAVWTPPPSPEGRTAGAAAAGAAFGVSGFGAGGGGAAAVDGSGFDGAGAAAPFSVSSTATSVCTGTVCPSCTLISATTPAAGAGISASTLSVEISKSGSSRLTVSPTFLSHLLKVPSAMDSPIWGMSTSTRAIGSPSVRRQPAGGLYDVFRLRQHEVLECRRVRQRHVVRSHAHDRPVEPFERLLIDPRGDLAGDAAGPRVFVNDQHFVRLLDGRANRTVVHRQQRAQVQHFDRHAVRLLELLGRLQRFPQRRAVADDGKMLSLARDPRLHDRREDLFPLRHVLLDAPVQPLVLEVEHRVFVANRRFDETLRVSRGRRVDDLETGRVEECRLRILRMEGPASHIAAAGAAYHHRG